MLRGLASKPRSRPHRCGLVTLLTALVVLPYLTAMWSPSSAILTAQAAPPSILVIQTDDMRADDLVVMPRTRALLEAGGISFDNYIAGGTPLCCPNRATALTGKYPHNHGVLRNGGPDGGHQAFQRRGNEGRTIAVALDDAGYETAYIGKYLNGYPAGRRKGRIPHGWDHWHAIMQDKGCDTCGGGGDGFYYTYQMNENGAITSYGADPQHYSTSVIRDTALRVIEQRGKASLFLWVNPLAPHGPSVPAPDDVAAAVPVELTSPAYNRRGAGKAGWIQRLPRMNGRLQAYVAERVRDRRRSLIAVDELVETLVSRMPPGSYVFFFSDNGYLLGEFRIAIGKTVPYKPAAEVPLLVTGPGIEPGRVTPLVASSIDLAPTWAEIAGAGLPGADGRSLLTIFEGQVPEWRDSVLLEWAGTTARTRRADLDGDILPVSLGNPEGRAAPDRDQRTAQPEPRRRGRIASKKRRAGIEQREFAVDGHYALRGATWLYIDWSDGTKEYYDHKSDPHELNNRYAELSPARREFLAKRVDRLKTCAGPDCD